MANFNLAHLLFILLLSTPISLAGKFRFSIQEIATTTTRDLAEDDLILGVVTSVNSGTSNKTWTLGSAKKGRTFKWDNLTTEVDVPSSGSNLSVAIGVMNVAEGGEKVAEEFAKGLVKVASTVPGPQIVVANLFNMFFGDIVNLLECDGPVVIGNAIYTAQALDDMEQFKKTCETRNYLNATSNIFCGIHDSNYTVTHCVERLDAKPAKAGDATAGAGRKEVWGWMFLSTFGVVSGVLLGLL